MIRLSGDNGRRCLWFERAEIGNDASPALGTARLADIAAVEDQPVVGVTAIGAGRDPLERILDLARGPAAGEPGAVGNAKDMGVDRDGFLAKGDVHDDISSLASDAGQSFKRLAAARHLSAILVDENARQGEDRKSTRLNSSH